AYFTSGGTDSALAFTQGSHYGFIFTFVLAFLVCSLHSVSKNRLALVRAQANINLRETKALSPKAPAPHTALEHPPLL
ncbi:MAG: hypothetical protein U0O24_00935, partial [Eggerthellaceae bacterium]